MLLFQGFEKIVFLIGPRKLSHPVLFEAHPAEETLLRGRAGDEVVHEFPTTRVIVNFGKRGTLCLRVDSYEP